MTAEITSAEKIVDLYRGQHPHVRLVQSLLAPVSSDLFGAYLHGSLATEEEIPYSDFDGLVILTSDVQRNPARFHLLQRRLRACERAMYQFDPLQHHGWFVLKEQDLSSYDDAYFPRELFTYAKSLLPERGQKLDIRVRAHSAEEMRVGFFSLARNFAANNKGDICSSMYQLKNVLSVFMLLPALYVQARDGRGIFKKFSFDAARADFSDDLWVPMDFVSTIRAEWRCEISRFRRFLLSQPFRIRRRAARLLSPAVPEKLRAKVSVDLQKSMDRLVSAMRSKLG